MFSYLKFLEDVAASTARGVPLVIKGKGSRGGITLAPSVDPPAWWDERPEALLHPAPWRNLTPRLQMIFHQRALERRGHCLAFTLHLSPKVIHAAQNADPSFIDYMRRRIARHRNSELGRKVDFWFTAERQKGRPHIHGAAGICKVEQKQARTAFNQAIGKEPGSGNQVVIKPIYDGDGWAGYGAKDIHRHWEITGNFGRGHTVSRDLNAVARTLYETACRQVIRFRNLRSRGPHLHPW